MIFIPGSHEVSSLSKERVLRLSLPCSGLCGGMLGGLEVGLNLRG